VDIMPARQKSASCSRTSDHQPGRLGQTSGAKVDLHSSDCFRQALQLAFQPNFGFRIGGHFPLSILGSISRLALEMSPNESTSSWNLCRTRNTLAQLPGRNSINHQVELSSGAYYHPSRAGQQPNQCPVCVCVCEFHEPKVLKSAELRRRRAKLAASVPREGPQRAALRGAIRSRLRAEGCCLLGVLASRKEPKEKQNCKSERPIRDFWRIVSQWSCGAAHLATFAKRKVGPKGRLETENDCNWLSATNEQPKAKETCCSLWATLCPHLCASA